MARSSAGPTVIGTAPSSDFAHRVFVGNRMIRWRPGDTKAAWHSDPPASGAGPQNVYARPRDGAGIHGDAARGTTSMRATFNATGSETERSYGYATISHVGRDVRVGATRATQELKFQRSQAYAKGKGPLHQHRRPKSAGAMRASSTLQYQRTLPHGAPARAAPGANDQIAEIAPPSAWTRSQIFANGRMTATQDMDGVARPQHKEKKVPKPVVYQRMSTPALDMGVIKPYSNPDRPASNYFRKSHNDSDVLWDRPGLKNLDIGFKDVQLFKIS